MRRCERSTIFHYRAASPAIQRRIRAETTWASSNRHSPELPARQAMARLFAPLSLTPQQRYVIVWPKVLLIVRRKHNSSGPPRGRKMGEGSEPRSNVSHLGLDFQAVQTGLRFQIETVACLNCSWEALLRASI